MLWPGRVPLDIKHAQRTMTSLAVEGVARSPQPLDDDADADDAERAEAPSRQSRSHEDGPASAQQPLYSEGDRGTVAQNLRALLIGKANARATSALPHDTTGESLPRTVALSRAAAEQPTTAAQPPAAGLMEPTAQPQAAGKAEPEGTSIISPGAGLSRAAEIATKPDPIALDVHKTAGVTRNASHDSFRRLDDNDGEAEGVAQSSDGQAP